MCITGLMAMLLDINSVCSKQLVLFDTGIPSTVRLTSINICTCLFTTYVRNLNIHSIFTLIATSYQYKSAADILSILSLKAASFDIRLEIRSQA